jgi:RNA polymerase sigma factor (sigma-70 family)
MGKSQSDFNNGGKESKEFCALLRRGRKSHKLIDELSGSPVFKRRLMALCRLLTFSESDAEDLYSEVCLKLCTVLGKFRPDYKRPYGNFFNWLGRVTRNTFFDIARHVKFRFTIESIDDWDVADLEYDLEDQFDMNELKWRLREGIRRLPKKKRWAVTLHIRGGYSSREAQKILKTWGLECSHAAITIWVKDLLCSVFPEAEDAIRQLRRKPNARARRPDSAQKPKENAEAEKHPAKVAETKNTAKR